MVSNPDQVPNPPPLRDLTAGPGALRCPHTPGGPGTCSAPAPREDLELFLRRPHGRTWSVFGRPSLLFPVWSPAPFYTPTHTPGVARVYYPPSLPLPLATPQPRASSRATLQLHTPGAPSLAHPLPTPLQPPTSSHPFVSTLTRHAHLLAARSEEPLGRIPLPMSVGVARTHAHKLFLHAHTYGYIYIFFFKKKKNKTKK